MCQNHQTKRSSNKDLQEIERKMDRRRFLTRTTMGIGSLALGSLLGAEKIFANSILPQWNKSSGGLPDLPHFLPKAKRIIYRFQSGGPSQLDLFDYKPKLGNMHGQELPDSVRDGQRLTGMSADQSSFPIASSVFNFKQYGECRAWVSELMPHTAELVDELCFIKSMHTEQINHDPAITFFQTGHQLPGRPSIGSWLSYGLGSDNQNLPSFIVL